MRILSIETSCDETALALVEANGGFLNPKFKVLKNLVSSQIKIHRPFGGVVPNLAKREHLKNLPILLRKFQVLGFRFQDIDLIVVTIGPGLEPALWAGIEFAKELAKKHKKPLIGASHLEGHLYSFLLSKTLLAKPYWLNPKNIFPAIALIVSGGHTILLLMESLVKRKKLGETRDDAVGEAFDKVARMLRLPYPGGPELERLALNLPRSSRPSINFPRPMMRNKSYDFSFSGLKTSVLYYLRDNPRAPKADVAASFEQAAIDVLVHKTIRAAKEYRAKSVMLSGGVAANKLLRKTIKGEVKKLGRAFIVPEMRYTTDNAAMIAAAGYLTRLRGKKHKLTAQGTLGI